MSLESLFFKLISKCKDPNKTQEVSSKCENSTHITVLILSRLRLVGPKESSLPKWSNWVITTHLNVPNLLPPQVVTLCGPEHAFPLLNWCLLPCSLMWALWSSFDITDGDMGRHLVWGPSVWDHSRKRACMSDKKSRGDREWVKRLQRSHLWAPTHQGCDRHAKQRGRATSVPTKV